MGKLTISVRRDVIIGNRQNRTELPAWRINDGTTERAARVIDFGGVRLIQAPYNSEHKGACYIEADGDPILVE
jgi:hypothetical protein